ncbi:MAG: hypothetical protein GVY36_18225 [Verrucomicrobia bacterium]|jgi:hypothetical protein|nr:hypothetical protein [Verrucomicrobiota bacterium]
MTDFFSPFTPHFYDYSRTGCTDENGNDVSNRDWFKLCLAGAYKDVADIFACTCKISDVEIENVRTHWLRDVDALSIEGGGVPDHFKQAGVLSYWLRRRGPIRELKTSGAHDTEVGRERQQVFLRLCHELSAFMIGFELCRYAEAKSALDQGNDAVRHIQTIKPDFKFATDVSILMRNKHISPHSLMMIYRAVLRK